MSTAAAWADPTVPADTLGVSVVAATTFAADRGLGGAVFAPDRLAGGELIHAHPLPDGQVLLAYGTTRSGATVSGAGYTGGQTGYAPRLFRTHPAAGGNTPVVDRGAAPGRLHTALGHPDTLRLVGGVTIGSRLVLLSTLERDGARVGHLSVFDTAAGALRHAAEMLLPDLPLSGARVRWDRGVFTERGYLIVVGADVDTGAVYLRALPLRDQLTAVARWTFCTGRGWAAYPTQAAPLAAVDGTEIVSAGPVSVAVDRGRALASTVRVHGDTAYAQLLYGGLFGLAPLPDGVDLGRTTDGSYLGGGLRLQGALPANGAHPAFADQRYGSGIPYCVTTATAALMSTAWGIWLLPRTAGYATGWVPRSQVEQWWADTVAPGTVAGSQVGDRYVDLTSGTTYRAT